MNRRIIMKQLAKLTLIILVFLSLTAQAATSNFTVYDNNTTFVVQGKDIKASLVSNQYNCWTYASNMYKKIWGDSVAFSSDFTGTASMGHNSLRQLSDADRTLTASHLKSYISNAELGAVVRICGCTSSCSAWRDDGLSCGHKGHNVVIVQKDSNGFTAVENAYPEGQSSYAVCTRYYTWQGFVNWWGGYGCGYIKYIKWPNAPVYNGSSSSSYSTVAYENCNYKIIKDVTLRKAPFDSAEKGSYIDADDNVTVTSVEIVDNGTNLWLKLGGAYNGQYIFAGYSKNWEQNGNQYLQYVQPNPVLNWENDNVTGLIHKQGSSYPIKGTLTFNHTIKNITAEFYKGASCWGNPVVVQNVNSTSYYLPSSTIDMNMLFGKLPTGNYTLALTVEYYTDRKLSTTTASISAPFTVASNPSSVQQAYLDVNGWLNGVLSDTLSNYGTCDVYINGSLVANDITDYYTQWPVGTSYEIKDIRATSAFAYNGVYSGSLSGTIGTSDTKVILDFERPTKPVVTVTPGDTYNATVFSWGATDYTTHYDVRIYDSSDKNIWSADSNENPYRTQTSDRLNYAALLSPGTYSVTIAASNQSKNSWYISDKVSFTVASASAPSAGTHIAQVEGSQHLYKVIKKSCTWLEAEYLAASVKGNLATITSSAEQSVVAALVQQAGFDCWLGAERYRKDAWAWITGESFSGYTNWAGSEPNNQNGQENVLEMSYATGKWNDTSCISTNKGAGYVVEFNPTSLSVSTKHGYYLSDTNLSKSDLTVKVTFADGTTLTTSDYEISAQSYANKSFTITVRYGNLTASCRANGIEAVSLGDDFYAVIRHIDSGKLIDSASHNTGNILYLTAEAFSDRQLWHFVRQPDGYYKIYQGEYLMELQGGHTDDHTPIRLYKENGNSAQWWYIQKSGSGYRLTSVKKPGSCIDVAGNNSADGTKIQLFGEHDKEGPQAFAIEKCVPVEGIGLDCSFTVQEYTGSVFTLNAELFPENATYRNVVWSSTDPSVAVVSQTGEVTITGSGIAEIICQTTDSSHQAECIIAAFGDHVLRLPADLKSIEEEAFAETTAAAVVLPESIVSIGAKAFADSSSLELIYMPDSLIEIAEDAFANCLPTFICATYNAAAEYAEAHGIPVYIIAF